MFWRHNGWMYILVALIAIGLFAQFSANPWGVILPLTIFGIIFYLYKFPPKWLLRLVQQPHPSVNRKRATATKSKQKTNRKRRKNVKLRVIDGKKKDQPPHRKTQ